MVEVIQAFVPFLVLASHILLVVIIFSRSLRSFINRDILLFGLLITLGAVVGSLFYSEVVGFEACILCWWQRLFLYPQAVLFSVAYLKNDRSVFSYSVPLSILAGVIALYHSYVYWGGESILSCTSLGGACSKIYVYAFGYITIPVMSLTVALYLLLLAWINKNARSNS